MKSEMNEWPEEIQSLPITPYLDDICIQLKNSPSRFFVLTAQTAAGKSTALPLALLKHFDGKIIMLEPRRLAVVAIANRVASLLHQNPGEECGYSLHLDSKISEKTRLEVVTEAILTKKLQNDPSLEGINVIVIDEFHERSVHADLALAFLKEVMLLRDDLYVIVMSATIDTDILSGYLTAPVISVPGKQYPVDIMYNSSDSLVSIIRNSLSDKQIKGSILVFFPGIYEINKAYTELTEYFNESIDICLLHSSIPLSLQKKVLSPVEDSSRIRVILSSSIAETSLTVPDVSLVIDTGKARTSTFDYNTGMQKLITETESQFSADQRAGRAGRTSRGKCIRMWDASVRLNRQSLPEILRTDLSQVVLECYNWGSKNLESIDFIDKPSQSKWDSALQYLRDSSLITGDCISQRGKAALKLGLSPRLSCVALEGLIHNCVPQAIDIIISHSEYSQSSPDIKNRFINDLKRRLSACTLCKEDKKGKISSTMLLLSGYTDRLALKIEGDSSKAIYQFPSGRKAILNQNTSICPQWIIAPDVDAGETTGRIHSYEKAEDNEIELWLKDRCTVCNKAVFEGTKLCKYEYKSFGKIILKKTKLTTDSNDYADAVCNTVQTEGLNWLPLSKACESLLNRGRFYGQNIDASLLDKIENLHKTAHQWLKPFITGTSISEKCVFDGLYWYLDGTLIDKEAPLEIILENGKKQKIIYENNGNKVLPVIEVIIQRIFGCLKNPKIAGVNVLLKLLSPARRPLQITSDLEGFWNGSWIEICKEMKGRYPKHNWDYRISEKE